MYAKKERKVRKDADLPSEENVSDGAHSVEAKDDNNDEDIAQQGGEDDGRAEDGAQNAKDELAVGDISQAGYGLRPSSS